MMRLNRKIEYALIALKYMSQKKPGQLSTAKEMSEKFGAPFDATSRVLQLMAHAGILKSEQGAHGGYLIVKDLSKISFYQLNELVLGQFGITKCFIKSGEGDCELQSNCNILAPVKNLNNKIVEFFKSLSLAEVIGSPSFETSHSNSEQVGNHVG